MGRRTPRSPSEHLEAKTHETKLMAAAGASRAKTDSSTALPGTAMGCGLDGSRGIINDAGIPISFLICCRRRSGRYFDTVYLMFEKSDFTHFSDMTLGFLWGHTFRTPPDTHVC